MKIMKPATVYPSMMKTVLFILIASVATASATPDAPRPDAPKSDAPKPNAAKCKAHGKIVFEIERLVTDKVQSKTKVFETGAWTIDSFNGDGKATSVGTGCFDKDTVAKIRADVKTSPWTVTHNKIHCMAVSINSTAYYANGKKVFTARMCNSDALDDRSQKNVEDLEALLKAPKSSEVSDVK